MKFLALSGLAALIVAANLSLARLIVNWWQGGNLALGSIVVVQPPTGLEKLGESLGQLLHAEIKNTVSQVKNIDVVAKSEGALTISQQPVTPTDLSVKIGSVDVSGVLAWVQSQFAPEKKLNFVIAFEADKALVTGDISALSTRKSYLHFEIPKATARTISSRVAYALYQAQLIETDNSEATALDPEDFQAVVETLAKVQDLDHRVRRKIIISPNDYVPHLERIDKVAAKAPTWRKLIEAQAALAIAAQRHEQARQIYTKLLADQSVPQVDRVRYTAQTERLKQVPLATALPIASQPRRDLSALDKNQLDALRNAFRKLYDDNTADGYQAIAGIYRRYAPFDPLLSPEKQLLFLAWNRAYLAYFEAALRKVDPALSLPYWDWAQNPRLPQAVSIGGNDNPLRSGPLRLVSADGKVLKTRATNRSATPDDAVPAAIARTSDLLSEAVFPNFEDQVRQQHNVIHGWTGGDMATFEAAFDPLFWFVHANIDRLWTLWQKQHPDVQFTDKVLDQKLEPFSKTVRDVVKAEKLGYMY